MPYSYTSNIAAHIVFIFCELQGVAVGMGLNGMKETYTTADRLFNKGYREVNPFFMPKILINMAAGHVSLKYGFQVCNFIDKRYLLFIFNLSYFCM